MTLSNNLKFMEDVFSKSNAEQLPPYRDEIDMTIDVPENTLTRIIPMAILSEKEKE